MSAPYLACLIPVRMGSARLPGKCLMPVCDRPLLFHLVQRALACRAIVSPEQVVVCTTEATADDALEEFARTHGLRCFRGAESNVVQRFHDAAYAVGADLLLVIDGDNPLCDPDAMDRVVEVLQSRPDVGYVGINGLPLGLAPRGMSRRGLFQVLGMLAGADADTGYHLLFTETDGIASVILDEHLPPYGPSTARLTVDYPEDVEMVQAVMDELYMAGEVFGAAEILDLLERRPELMSINAERSAEYWQRWYSKAGVVDRGAGS